VPTRQRIPPPPTRYGPPATGQPRMAPTPPRSAFREPPPTRYDPSAVPTARRAMPSIGSRTVQRMEQGEEGDDDFRGRKRKLWEVDNNARSAGGKEESGEKELNVVGTDDKEEGGEPSPTPIRRPRNEPPGAGGPRRGGVARDPFAILKSAEDNPQSFLSQLMAAKRAGKQKTKKGKGEEDPGDNSTTTTTTPPRDGLELLRRAKWSGAPVVSKSGNSDRHSPSAESIKKAVMDGSATLRAGGSSRFSGAHQEGRDRHVTIVIGSVGWHVYLSHDDKRVTRISWADG